MTLKEKMVEAQTLIKAKNYDKARVLLEQIDHPRAKKWLQQIDTVASISRRSKPAATRQRQKASRKRLPLLLGSLIAVALIGIAVVAFFSMNNNQSQPTSTETVEALTDPDDPIVLTGYRIPFVNRDALFTVELPQGWVCDCGTMSGNLETVEDSFNNRVDVRVASRDVESSDITLETVLQADINADEKIVSQENIEANGRTVLFAVVMADDADDDEQEHRYYVHDSDGYVVVLSIPDNIDEPSELADVVLAIAANIESNPEGATNFTNRLLRSAQAYNETLNRWRVADVLDGKREHTLELPPEWAIQAGILGLPMAVKSDSPTTSATAITYIRPSFYGGNAAGSLAEIVTRLNEGNTVQSQDNTTVNGREIYFTLTTDASTGSNTATYYVQDEDGDVMALIIQPDVPDKASLHDDLLVMASTVESNEAEYLTRLVQAGLINGVTVPDDGFVPIR